ncbi:hypothetical protein ACFPPD_16595 [Cohnella suwonensis]|uniref:Uncharacterized protein n=1 Tax=Cohnella suwonensis TaxID=696072 RepID=A0ABW0LZ80_9BACL
MRRMVPLLAAALLTLLLAGCGAGSNNKGATDAPLATPSAVASFGIEPTNAASEEPSPSASASPSPSQPVTAQAALVDKAKDIAGLLRERDISSLQDYIDPDLGLRFSPSVHLSDTDLSFKPDQLPGFKDSKKRVWGTADGSGDPIELSFRDYYEKFVYNKDYADAPDVNVGKSLGTGNTTFNVMDVYPNASYVEFYYPGTDVAAEGMDWQSLLLAFVPAGDDWSLVAVVHGQWTI